MKKVFKIEDIDCANCARKIEDSINAIEGVERASLNFMAQKLTIEAEEALFDEIMKKALKAAKRVEPDCRIVM